MGDVDDGGNCACVGTGRIWEISVPSVQFCCELKTALKNSLLKKKKKKQVASFMLVCLEFLGYHWHREVILSREVKKTNVN